MCNITNTDAANDAFEVDSPNYAINNLQSGYPNNNLHQQFASNNVHQQNARNNIQQTRSAISLTNMDCHKLLEVNRALGNDVKAMEAKFQAQFQAHSLELRAITECLQKVYDIVKKKKRNDGPSEVVKMFNILNCFLINSLVLKFYYYSFMKVEIC